MTSWQQVPKTVHQCLQQWQSRFMRYVDTNPNMKELKKCILNGPYVMTRVLVLAKSATEIDPPVPDHTVQETYENTLPVNHAYIDAEAEAIHIILSGIGDEIYFIVDACKTAQEIKFTLRDGESIESYYSRFYKMMNEMIRNQMEVANIQVNQYQNEVNEIRAKEIARNANPLALVAAAQ
ncbi:hypothetical protein Tco_1030298 [Tanacetum coccineum]|uniref:Gag protein n=1 Tax=Tanacetum coccineum TaxID=301880 RepID=A0ABQ5G5U1_9ASTR